MAKKKKKTIYNAEYQKEWKRKNQPKVKRYRENAKQRRIARGICLNCSNRALILDNGKVLLLCIACREKKLTQQRASYAKLRQK